MTRIPFHTSSASLRSFHCDALSPQSLLCRNPLLALPSTLESRFVLRSFLVPMTRISVLSLLLAVITGTGLSRAESHTISFVNKCGEGTPQLVIGGKILSNGEDWTSNGPQAGIAYLQTGQCQLNGEGCALLEFNMINPTCAGCGSTADISLISPHALNVPIAFSYLNGCNGQGATCTTPDCRTAFHLPNDNQVQVACQVDNVGLLVTFCPDGNSDQPPPAPAPVPASSNPTLPASATTTLAPPSSSSSHISYVPVRSSDVPSPPKPGVSSSPLPAPGPQGGINLIQEPKPTGDASRKTCKRRYRHRVVARAAA